MATEMLSERQGSCLVLTLSDPATRNSLSPQASAAAVEALGAAEGDDEVRAVVFRGAGEHFCGGGNLQRLQSVRHKGPDEQLQSMEHLHAFVETLRSYPKPVIAAVEGFAAGAGCALVMACDLVVAARNAKFVLSYGRVGLSPDGGTTWQLARSVSRAQALRMIWLAEPMTAQEWLAMGLVNEIVDPGQSQVQALAWADRLAGMAPNAIASAKELMNDALDRSLPAQLDQERSHFVRNLFHANGGEGVQAFLEKRPPHFKP